MLKRIIIGPSYPLRGGISESNYALQSSFKKKGEIVKVISYSLQYPKFLFPGKTQTMDDTKKFVDNTFNLINTLNPLSWLKAANFILQQKPDYVIVRYWHPYFSICLSVIIKILTKKNIFCIGWIDNINPHESIPFQSLLTSIFLKQCNAFIVMSNAVKNDLLQYKSVLNRNVIHYPHPVYNIFGHSISKNNAKKNIGISEYSIKNNDKYILFFGLVREYKGLNLLLDVMASNKIKEMGIKLIIAGEFYDSKKKYITKINSLNLKKRVLLYDFYIKNKDVVNYFCASDIVVQPYLSATQSGVSMVAYNFNKPTLLTNVGGLSEYVDHQKSGYLVPPDINSIVLALEDFYINGREDVFSNVIKNKKFEYSWSGLGVEFDELYKKSKYD